MKTYRRREGGSVHVNPIGVCSPVLTKVRLLRSPRGWEAGGGGRWLSSGVGRNSDSLGSLEFFPGSTLRGRESSQERSLELLESMLVLVQVQGQG